MFMLSNLFYLVAFEGLAATSINYVLIAFQKGGGVSYTLNIIYIIKVDNNISWLIYCE